MPLRLHAARIPTVAVLMHRPQKFGGTIPAFVVVAESLKSAAENRSKEDQYGVIRPFTGLI